MILRSHELGMQALVLTLSLTYQPHSKPQSTFAAGLLGTVRSERHLDQMTPESLHLYHPVNLFLGAEKGAPISLKWHHNKKRRVNTTYASLGGGGMVTRFVDHVAWSKSFDLATQKTQVASLYPSVPWWIKTLEFFMRISNLLKFQKQLGNLPPLKIFVPAIASCSCNTYSLFQVPNAVLTNYPKHNAL